MKVDNLLNVGIRSFSGIDDRSILASFDNFGHFDVLDFTNTSNAFYRTQFVDKVAMSGRIDQCLLQRSTNDGTSWQMLRHLTILIN